ncbi:acyl-CoA dehydrogenase [Luteimicrobium subarcticum]|uniref:acyl-CoA oxidase n=1 Tax=Luteimicrobium subarcticum TaxID=620910 RepID=A0A2M8WSD8_9MICO|nr:acyl-CoA dehydrogenase [Luteimicrobium subarcticum]PJI93804.1 acyl-coenzyme A oxidase [Luteimicrobium subarcticum]
MSAPTDLSAAHGAIATPEVTTPAAPTDDHASAPERGAPRVDVPALESLLLGRWAPERRKARGAACDDRYVRVDGLTMDEHRERVFGQLGLLVEEGHVLRAFPTRLGGADMPGGNIAAFEELAAADLSLQIKSGVQWGLFGAAILHLGTPEQQDRLLPGAMSLAVPGAFAMTETGHGSDVASIATTATYDPETGEFDLHTPFRGAWKDYLGNAGKDGVAATVFAQLVTAGVNHGVHCFYVPIREVGDDGRAGAFLPGVGGEDDGLKGGLNGIDNGRLHFTHVRVPRENLLARYGTVAADGTYASSIESPGRRFFTMLGSLVQGRVSLDGASSVVSKMALAIAVRYGNERRQFAGAGLDEVVLLDYGRHQRRLIPRIAETYAMSFAHDRLLDLFDAVFSGEHDDAETREELETMAAALKSTSTWFTMDTLQEVREACGGAGFLAQNRVTQLRHDFDIYTTFEGDNNVLLQLVGKRLLTEYGKQFKGISAGGMARYVVDRAADLALHGTPLHRAVQTVVDGGSARRAAGHLRDEATQRELLTYRVEAAVAELAGALRSASKLSPQEAFDLFNAHQNELITVARAHGQLLKWEAFTQTLAGVEDEGTRQVLTWARDLFGLSLVERELGWYLVNGRLSAQRARTVTSYIDRLVGRLRPHAQDLVDAFGYGPEHLRAEVATGNEKARQDEARAYLADLVASGDAPVSEKSLQRSKRG